jgi:O-antigen ligase
VIAILSPLIFFSEDTLLYLNSAFSAEDERSIQKRYLIEGFWEMPLFGSGFGGLTEYVRSEESPWLYELSFHQILFNFGVVGSVLLTLSFLYTFIKAVRTIKANAAPAENGVVSVLFGACGLLIGAYSNPYLGSFDYLLVLGFLPLVISGAPKWISRF